jgi:hypothetical protein
MLRNSLVVLVVLLRAANAWAEGPTFAVSAHGSLETFRTEESPRGVLREVRLSAAQGETESFQVAITHRAAQPLRDVRVTVTGLGDVAATVFAAGAVHVPKPGRTGGMQAGHYFDLLRPAGVESIEPGKYALYWIDLKIPTGATPGVRRGRVSVSTSAGCQTLPVELRIRAFQLPATPTLKLAFACGLSWMEAYYGRRLTKPEVHGVQDLMLEHRLGPVPMWSPGAELFGDEQRLRHCLAGGLNVVILVCGGQTDAEIERSLDALEPKIELLRRVGALDRTYLFGYDEITMGAPEQIPAMGKAYRRFHERHPEIRRVNTSAPDRRLTEFVDIFVVPTGQFVLPMAKAKEVWWYSVGSDDLGNQPDFRIDFPAVVHRSFFLADWKAGVRGHLYWAVQREWPANRGIRDKHRPELEWRTGYHHASSNAWVEDNGGGNLFYPDGGGGMLPTPRVKRIRDGIEDYEYLAQLQRVVADLARRKPAGWEAACQSAHNALTVPDSVVRVGAGWREGWQATTGDEACCTVTMHPRAIHGGLRALRIVPDRAELVATQDQPIRAGQGGVFAGWLKTDDLTGAARLTAEYLDAAGHSIQRVAGEPVSGSSRKFVRRELALPAPPAAATKLRLGLSARVDRPSTGPKTPIQKAFFDDLSLTLGGKGVPLVNPGFEAEKLRMGLDTAALAAYRERVAECLEQCLAMLAKSK